jgi:cystathionine gamma-synthase
MEPVELMDDGSGAAGECAPPASEDAGAETCAAHVAKTNVAHAAHLAELEMGAICIGAELRADVERRMVKSILRMERFLRRDECQSVGALEPTRRLGLTLIHEARHMLRDALHEFGAVPSEPTLRSAYRLVGALEGLAAWSAPATQESHALGSFPFAATRDAVAYSRFGSDEIAAQESAYTAMLGFDPEQSRLLLTSSGMTAYALIESYLLREVLKPQDRILLHPSVYFETRQQIMTLPHVVTCTATGGGRAEMLASIAACRPKVVFVDPLSNADFRTIDMPKMLAEADQICEAETWFVVDSTLLSGGFDPFCGAARRHVRVLYYESGCKYLQFGMDLGPAGLVVVETALAERFERLRRGIGAIGSEALVLPRASRAAYLAYLRSQTTCALLVAQAVAEASTAETSNADMTNAGASSAEASDADLSNAEASSAEASNADMTMTSEERSVISEPRVIRAVFPAHISHPDHGETKRYAHLGGVLVFRFAEPHLNRRQPLEEFIDLLMTRARSANLSLTAGVSFGFCVPRIGAAWTSFDADEAFLRLSAGIDRDLAAALGRLIVRCAHEFATPALKHKQGVM